MEELLKTAARDFIEEMERDKRIMVSRYVYGCRENPKTLREMGFVQYLMNKWPHLRELELTDNGKTDIPIAKEAIDAQKQD